MRREKKKFTVARRVGELKQLASVRSSATSTHSVWFTSHPNHLGCLFSILVTEKNCISFFYGPFVLPLI